MNSKNTFFHAALKTKIFKFFFIELTIKFQFGILEKFQFGILENFQPMMQKLSIMF